MKNSIHKMAVNSSLVLLAALPVSQTVLAAEDKTQSTVLTTPLETSGELQKQKILAEHNQKVINEAKEALLGTQQVLLNLDKHDSANALRGLQEVSQKLDAIMTNNPTLVSVAADVEVDVIDFKGNAKAVEQKVRQASELLNHGKLQAGRLVVEELASEMDITTVSIPLASYTLAIKNALTQLNADKTNEAAQLVEDGLHSLVEQTEIIPLPVMRAEALIVNAYELEQKADLTKDKNRTEVLKLVSAAKDELSIAQLLGYGSKDDYHPFYKAIEDIKTTMDKEKSAASWAKLKQTLADLKNKIIPTKK